MNQVDAAGISWRPLADNSGRVDATVLLFTAPFLLVPGLFPRFVAWIALVVLIVPFAVRFRGSGHLTRHTPGNLPVAILLIIFIPLSLITTPAFWEITWPRVTTLTWSITLFFAVVNWPPPEKERPGIWTRWMNPSLVYLALGGIIALIGFLGMRRVDKLFTLPIGGAMGEWLGIEQGLPTNEIAGILTLFIPFSVALLLAVLLSSRRRALWWLFPLTLLMLVTLVLSQSRTGIVASMIGVILVVAISGIINRKWLIAILGIVTVAAIIMGMSGYLDRFIFAGANSWASVTGPRLEIWQQALDGIRDHSPWGMGFGVFGRSAGLLYPLTDPAQARVLEDAHNLYLQTALDFGVAGGLVFTLLLVVAAITAGRLVIESKQDRLSRLWAAGVFAALIAHLLYSLTDAVALGTVAGIPLWFLLGLIFGPAGKPAPDWSVRVKPAVLLGGMVAIGILVSVWFWHALPVNRAGQLTARYLLADSVSLPETATVTRRLAAYRCPAYWFEGLLYQAAGESAARSAAWKDLLACTDRFTRYMSVVAAEDTDLARKATQLHPESAAAHFWLAAALTDEDPDAAIVLYRQGLSLDPGYAYGWQMLGDLLVSRDALTAEEAYYQSCINGDPGANGCLRAGGLAEARGDIVKAIEYLRLSKFDEAQARADDLEAQLSRDHQSN